MSSFDAAPAPPHKKHVRKTDYLEGKPRFLNLTYEIRPLTLITKPNLHTIYTLVLHHRFAKRKKMSFEYHVWFNATSMAHQTFLAPCPTCHRLISVLNLATSVASILLVTLSMAAKLC